MAWLDEVFAPIQTVFDESTPLPQQTGLVFIGAQSIVDSPTTNQTIVTLPSGGGSGASQGTVALANGLNSNVLIANTSSIRFYSYTGAVILGGMNITPAPPAGVPFDVEFTVAGQKVTIRNSDASSSVGNQILTGTLADVDLPLGQAPRARFVRTVVGGVSSYNLQTSGVHQRRGADVSDFGAKGDSTTDDAPAIQAAINANPGGDIYIPVPPSGGYKVDSEITLSVQGTRVICEGRGGSSCLFLPGAPMRSVFTVAAAACELKGVFVYDTARNADYHFLRNGDGGSKYEDCSGYYAKIDGMHAAQIRNPTIGTVTQTGAGSGTVPTVTVYASPSEGLPYQIKCTTGGTISGGGVAFTIEANGDAGTLIGPFTVPADGFIQFPHYVGYGNANGMLVQFPTAATYSASPQDAFSWTVGGADCLNGTATTKNCFFNGAGQIYATAAFLGSNHYINYPADQKTAAPGTVLLTSGSQNIAGNGTAFLATGARPNDFIRVGTFSNWAASTTVPTGYLMSLGFIGSPQLTAAPGYAYVWEATTGGTTGSSPPVPAFSTVGVNPLGSGIGNQSPIGSTVEDGSVVWTCVCANVYQVLRVAGNGLIVVNFHGNPGFAGAPALPAYFTTGLGVVSAAGTTPPAITLGGTPTSPHTVLVEITTGGTYASGNARFKYSLDGGSFVTGQTPTSSFAIGSTGATIDFNVTGTYATDNVYSFQIGVDYAILVGSGYYEDSSGNNNTCIFENNNFNENAAFGMAMQPDYGHKIVGGQCTNNGVGGISTCVDGNAAENIVIDHVYMEGNLVVDHYLSGTFGFEIIQDVVQSPSAHAMNPGDESSGVWHGSIAGQAQDPEVESAFGSTYSSVPVTQTGQGVLFTMNGPSAKTSGNLTPVAATPIDVSVSTGVGKSIIKLTPSGATTMTATPLLANGTEGQEVVLLNIGNYPITFTGSTYPTAVMFCEESITLGIGDSVELRCIVNVQGYPVFWYQTGPVSHGVCVNGGQSTSITLANGLNSNVAIRGRKHLEIVGPTGAFSISGFIPAGSGDVGLGSGENGIPLELLYFGNQAMTLKHNDTGAEANAYQCIWCPGGVDLAITGVASDYIYVRLNYNVTKLRWLVKDHS